MADKCLKNTNLTHGRDLKWVNFILRKYHYGHINNDQCIYDAEKYGFVFLETSTKEILKG